MDIGTNYLSEIGCGNFTAESLLISKETDLGKKWIRTINQKAYIDPDSKSKKLYDDLFTFYNNKKFPNGNYMECIEVIERRKDNETFLELKTNIVKRVGLEDEIIAQVGLGADYIGPSIYWACEAGMNFLDIGKFLEKSRTFGGHIIWPRWIGSPKKNGRFGYDFVKAFKSINLSRGGEKGLFDRIDLTLFELNEWYLKRECKLKSSFDKNEIWLKQFVDFQGFIDFFSLDEFVDIDTYRIKDTTSFYDGNKYEYLDNSSVYPASIPKDTIAYKSFADGSTHLIEIRNKLLEERK